MPNTDWENYVAEVREKSAALLRGLVEERVRIFPVGRGKYKCISPVRAGDTDPSFHFDEAKGFWHDFGSSDSGDAISFVRLTANMSFREAVDDLARRAGISTWDERKKNGASHLTNEDLLELWNRTEDAHQVRSTMTSIVLLCHELLPSQIREYLQGHYGLTNETIDDEKIGWCIDGLYPYCKDVMPTLDEGTLMATGFFLKTSDGVKTHLGGRILFPYWKDGQVVYTIGREHHFGIPIEKLTIEDHDKGKYKKHLTCSPAHSYVSSALSNDHFWGEDTLKSARGETGYITEGVTDALMLKQLGFAVISPVTKEFKEKTIPHAVELLKRCKETVILNDNEEKVDLRTGEIRNPGMEGAIRMAEALHLAKCAVKIGTLPRGTKTKIDVNEIASDILKSGGTLEDAKKRIKEISDAAKPIVQFLIEKTEESASPSKLTALVSDISRLSVHANKVEHDAIVAEVRARFPKLSRESVRDVLKTTKQEIEKKEREARAQEKVEEKKSRLVRGVFDQMTYYDKYVPGEKESVPISTFSLVLKHVALSERRNEPDLLCVDVIGKNSKVYRRDWVVPAHAWISAKNFIGSFPSMFMQWFGSDLDVMSVYQMLADSAHNADQIRSVHTFGLHEVDEKRRFVVMAGTMDENGWMAIPDVNFMSNRGSSFQTLLPSTQTDPSAHLDLLRKVLEKSYTLQCPDLAFPMISWFGSTMFKPELFDMYSSFPILMIYGTQGSGKTTSTRFFWRLFTGAARASIGSTQSKFALTSDAVSSSSLPVFFDEYRPEKMSAQELNNLNNTLRLAYDNAYETKGTKNLGLDVWRLSSPLILAGEHAMDEDSALVERMIFASGNKNWLERSDQESFLMLDAQPVEKCAPYLYQWRVRTEFDPIYEKAKISFTHFFGRVSKACTVTSRVRHNIEQLFTGYFALVALASDLQVKIPEIDLYARMEDVLLRILGSERQYDTEDGITVMTDPRTALDTFLHDFVIMAIQGEVKEDVHYAKLNEDLFVHTDSVYEMRAAWRRSSGKSSDSVGLRGLRQIATENKERNGYIKRVSHTGRLHSWRDLVTEPRTPAQLGIAQRVIEEKTGPREVQVRGFLIDMKRLPVWIGLPPLTFNRKQGLSKAETDMQVAMEEWDSIKDPSHRTN